MDENEHDVLAYMAFLRQHRTKLHSTNPIECLNKEVKRRTDVVGIIPNEDSINRLIGAVLFEQNDEWQSRVKKSLAENPSSRERASSVDPFLAGSKTALPPTRQRAPTDWSAYFHMNAYEREC